ncbi:MAG: hypothetical protein AAFN70_11385, partial [Planctomycetota bacterium]
MTEVMNLENIEPDWVLRQRDAVRRSEIDPTHPYAIDVDVEPLGDGRFADVLTVFLSVAECPLRCVMCDLWKNTLPQQTVNGDVVTQIRHARSEFSRRLQERDDDSPRPRWIKLY